MTGRPKPNASGTKKLAAPQIRAPKMKGQTVNVAPRVLIFIKKPSSIIKRMAAAANTGADVVHAAARHH